MVPSARVWFASFVGLVFFVGLSAGVLVDRAWLLRGPAGGPPRPDVTRPNPPNGPPVPPPDRVVNDLDRVLHLTDDEKQKISAILEAHRPRVQQIQTQARQLFIDEQNALQREIGAVLTPDQLKTFEDEIARQTIQLGPRGGPPGGRPGRGRGPRNGGPGRGPREGSRE